VEFRSIEDGDRHDITYLSSGGSFGGISDTSRAMLMSIWLKGSKFIVMLTCGFWASPFALLSPWCLFDV
jgi:hypothetical protein